MRSKIESRSGAAIYTSRLLRTLRDIPLQQHAHRLCFELRSRALQRGSAAWLERLARLTTPPIEPRRRVAREATPARHASPGELADPTRAGVSDPSSDAAAWGDHPDRFRFSFLGTERVLSLPLNWHPIDVDRLWRFNLHYFDGLRAIIGSAPFADKIEASRAARSRAIMADWIRANPFGRYDAWHPYPTSLRVVNWSYALRAIDSLRTEDIERSLWRQLNYLTWNKEYYAGGNHLLENLRALIVTGSYFEGRISRSIVLSATRELAGQLTHQILPSGLHYERTTTYHLIVLQLVLECALAVRAAGIDACTTLDEPLAAMHDAAVGFGLEGGAYPLTNDAAFDLGPPLHPVLNAVRAYFGDHTAHGTLTGFFRWLLDSAQTRAPARSLLRDMKGSTHVDLDGYHMIRSQRGLQLWFDTALTCPAELPAHGHADTLNVDIFWRGTPIVVETGTSIYQAGEIRTYERSTSSHNTVTVNGLDQSEIWGAFRIGRKARPTEVASGAIGAGAWVAAGHDGYVQTSGVMHHRWVGLVDTSIVIVDRLTANQQQARLVGRFHLAPTIEVQVHGSGRFLLTGEGGGEFQVQWMGVPSLHHLPASESGSWYAPRFGERIPRGTLQWSETLPAHTTRVVAMAIGVGKREPTIALSSNATGFTISIGSTTAVRHTW